MKKVHKVDTGGLNQSRDTRPTIGYLTPEAVVTQTAMGLWSGVEAGARECDLNLIAFPGGNLRSKLRGQANIIYELITPETFAGLVTWAAALQHSAFQDETLSEEELNALHTRYHPLPIVTLSKTVPGYPAALVESEQGIRDAIAHLIEVHGCRRIAFIRGPEAHPLAEARYRAYLDALADHGIGVNANLVTPPGGFADERGAQAVDLFLDQRNLRPKEDLEAIVAASDVFALTAMKALQRRDIRVPKDVAIVGFNDFAEARCASPSITSVTVPFREQGRQAVCALERLLEGESVPDETLIPSRLAVHQSCGCLDATVVQAGTFSPRVGQGLSLEETFVTRREIIVREMVQAMDISEGPAWAERVLDSFILDLSGSQPNEFLTVLREVLRRAPLADRVLPAWQNVLSVLQYHAASYVDSQKALLLIGQARTLLGETTSRAFAQQQLQAERRVQALQTINSALIATFEVKRLMDVLAEGLPTLGIPSCYLALYEDPQPYLYPQPAPEWSRLVLAYNEGGRVALEEGGKRFFTRHILPEGMWPAHRRYTMVLQPLYFQDAQIGFALFEVGPQDWSVYDVLRGEIASALQGALLVQRVQEHSAELTRQQYILDTFMENVPDRVYFKDLESRITRANKAHAVKMGLDPTEEIGKSDFDFFPEEEARVKYEQEQEIIRTGQPILNLEEVDGMGYWALTTKMPLRDENGEIIGTFGISRDITEMKRVQAELMRQERLSALGRLTATVAHEIRNPLGTVRTCVFTIGDAIERDELEQIERALQLAERNILRCDAIITELLDFTRDRALRRSPTDIDAWLNGVLDEMLDQGTIPESIICTRELNANAEVSADTEYLRRAVINVVNNAVDAMQEDGESENRLTISTHIIDEKLEIRVRDTGCGIPDEVMDKLFEPLFSTKSFGVGLGLSIVKNIIEQHGGGIEISSQANEGATVALWLPISENEGN
jgi:PAS domain S-box-containing protein